ncbi:MAG: sigma 54-interacting transcriptional regulator [Acidobacteria bacterium]|nr:sigma 54-interacting transcriptional regulator [Acidobacteriota bacterium]
MLRIGIVEDELRDLLDVISNLRALDPSGERIGIVPLLIAADSLSSIDKEAAASEKYLRAALAAKGIDQLVFPAIIKLGQLDLTRPLDRAQALARLAQEQVEIILSDSWMGNDFAGVLLLDAALSEQRWAAQAWKGWLMTKHERVAMKLLFRPSKFDPYRCYINKSDIIRTTLGECDSKLAELIEQAEQQKQASSLVRGLRQFEFLVGASPLLNGPNGVYEMIEVCAGNSLAVLINGESGTGKDLAAQSIHERSERRNKKMISINCSAFQESLLESQLFGYVKGAFTGAQTNKDGLFKAANGSTLFLDEIGEMSQAMQVKLLRALENKRIMPVGATEDFPVDVRIIAATKQNLPKMIEAGQFREDLYYRISVIRIEMPTLRARPEDIPILTHHFANQFKGSRPSPIGVSQSALNVFQSYDWPGNVRELCSRIEEALAFMRDGHTLDEENPVIKRLAEESRRRANTGSLPAISASSVSATGNEADPALASETTVTTSTGSLYRDMSTEQLLELIKRKQVVKKLSQWAKIIGVPKTIELANLTIQWLHGRLPNDSEAQEYFNESYTAWKGWLHQNKKKLLKIE